MTEEELRDAWEEWRAEKTNLPYLEWLEQKVRKQKEEAEDQKLFGQFVGLFLSTWFVCSGDFGRGNIFMIKEKELNENGN